MFHLDPVDTVLQSLKHRADFCKQAGARAGQADTSGLTLEQRESEGIFKGANLFADGALGQAQLGCGAGKAAITGNRLERDQCVERWQVFQVAAHGFSCGADSAGGLEVCWIIPIRNA